MADAIERSVTRRIVTMKSMKTDWIEHANKLHITSEEWEHIFDITSKKFITRKYPSMFAQKLNELVGIQCDVTATGPYVSTKRYTVRMKCSQLNCGRQYLFTAIHNNKPIGDDGIDFKVQYFSVQPPLNVISNDATSTLIEWLVRRTKYLYGTKDQIHRCSSKRNVTVQHSLQQCE